MSRIGLGCMRLSTDVDHDEPRALDTLYAAIAAGVTWLDTARAYTSPNGDLGHNERLVARILSAHPHLRVSTKCGMTRPAGRWEPDGRASAILADARASALDLGRAPDILYLHAPDPSVPFATSVRALVRAKEEGLCKAIGLSNVSRKHLDALGDVEIAAVQIALGAYDDTAARGGVVSWCKERGILVHAYAPLGGPARAPKLGRAPILRAITSKHPAATPAEIVVAYLLTLAPNIVPLVGARQPATASSALAAERIVLDDDDLAKLDARFPGLATVRRPLQPVTNPKVEVVLLMGIAGAGKSRLAESYVARGYERLNRDTLGGTLGGIAKKLEARLAEGAPRVILDNTYLTRASRSEAIRLAHRAGASVTCVHLETSAHDAQVNLVHRMLERHGALLGDAALAAATKTDTQTFGPSVLFRMERDLEPPAIDEGFTAIERVAFVREHQGIHGSLAIPIDRVFDRHGEPRPDSATLERHSPPDARIFVFGHQPLAPPLERIAALFPERIVEVAVCAHASGPPTCWCRPPLPGLWLAFARKHAIDPRQSAILVSSPAHRTMATRLGLRIIDGA